MEKRIQLLTSVVQCFIYLNFLRASGQGSFQSQYIGCFYDTSSQANWTARVQDSSTMAVDVCINRCKETTTTFAILQSGRNCLCGDILNVSFPFNTCQLPCSGDPTQVCGGNDKAMTLSVIFTVCPVGYYGTGCDQVCHCKQNMPCYRFSGKCPNGCESSWSGETCNKESNISDRYLGCYADGQDPNPRAMDPQTLTEFGQTNTIEVCSEYCTSKGYMYTYAGMEYSSYCFCGESYDKYGTSTNCNMACSGNRTQICGGSWANSVYSVCPNGTYGKDCVARCNCLNNAICTYGNGRCASSCEPGWSGGSCSNRDCSVNNGACSANESCVTTASVSRCQCSAGYQKTRLWDDCTDTDECKLNPCDDAEREYCLNSVGSFTCVCQTGFERNNSSGMCENSSSNPSKIDSSTAPPKICEQQAYSVGVVVGSSIGSAVVSSILTVLAGYAVSFFRRRQRQLNKQSEDTTDNRRKQVTGAQVESPISLFAYETLNKMPKQTDSAYTELTGKENRREANETETKFETGIREQHTANQFDRDTSKVYEELE